MKFGSEVRGQVKLGHAVKKHCPPGEKKYQNKVVLVTPGIFHRKQWSLTWRTARAVSSAPLTRLSSTLAMHRSNARRGRFDFGDQLIQARVIPCRHSIPSSEPGHPERTF